MYAWLAANIEPEEVALSVCLDPNPFGGPIVSYCATTVMLTSHQSMMIVPDLWRLQRSHCDPRCIKHMVCNLYCWPDDGAQ